MSNTDAQKRAKKRYEEKLRRSGTNPTKAYHLKCHKIHDADIIKRLETQDNKNGYLKELIRDDIKKQG